MALELGVRMRVRSCQSKTFDIYPDIGVADCYHVKQGSCKVAASRAECDMNSPTFPRRLPCQFFPKNLNFRNIMMSVPRELLRRCSLAASTRMAYDAGLHIRSSDWRTYRIN